MAVVTTNCFIFYLYDRFSPQKCTFPIKSFLFLPRNKQRTPKLMFEVPFRLLTAPAEAGLLIGRAIAVVLSEVSFSISS